MLPFRKRLRPGRRIFGASTLPLPRPNTQVNLSPNMPPTSARITMAAYSQVAGLNQQVQMLAEELSIESGYPYEESNTSRFKRHHDCNWKSKTATFRRFENAELDDCTLSRCVLVGSRLSQCKLVNCILIDSKITASDVSKSNLKSCHIYGGDFKVESGVLMPTTFSTLTTCFVQCTALFDAELGQCIFTKETTLRNCQITRSIGIDSVFRFCDLSDVCGALDSTLVRCSWTREVRNVRCQIKGFPKFAKLPPELRRLVFAEALRHEDMAGTLLAAIGSTSTYRIEILEVLVQDKHFFVLSYNNTDHLRRMDNKTLPHFSALKINTHRMEPSDTKDASVYFPTNENLHKLTLEIRGATAQLYQFYDVAKYWLKYFGTIGEFELTWKTILASHTFDCPPTLASAAEIAERKLGVKVEYTKDIGKDGEQSSFRWVWKAEKGRTLSWQSARVE